MFQGEVIFKIGFGWCLLEWTRIFEIDNREALAQRLLYTSLSSVVAMDYSDSIEIVATAEFVFATISDLPSMGRLSPENTGGEWLGGATDPALGAKFKGSNARNGTTWSTTARVTTFEPPSRFAFNVTYGPFRVAKWEYAIEPTLEGCRVIESWMEQRNAFVRRADKKDGFDRVGFTKESIRVTLAALKKICEAPANEN